MQESSSYNTIEIISNIPISRSESWIYPGVGTCSNVTSNLTITSSLGPAVTEAWYDRHSFFEWRENRKTNGRTHSKSGLPFRMTPYRHGSEEIFNHLTKREYAISQVQVFRQLGRNYRVPGYA